VEAAGYDGLIEVEIFNERLREMPLMDLLTLTVERFTTCV
jgi:hypothetical protein